MAAMAIPIPMPAFAPPEMPVMLPAAASAVEDADEAVAGNAVGFEDVLVVESSPSSVAVVVMGLEVLEAVADVELDFAVEVVVLGVVDVADEVDLADVDATVVDLVEDFTDDVVDAAREVDVVVASAAAGLKTELILLATLLTTLSKTFARISSSTRISDISGWIASGAPDVGKERSKVILYEDVY